MESATARLWRQAREARGCRRPAMDPHTAEAVHTYGDLRQQRIPPTVPELTHEQLVRSIIRAGDDRRPRHLTAEEAEKLGVVLELCEALGRRRRPGTAAKATGGGVGMGRVAELVEAPEDGGRRTSMVRSARCGFESRRGPTHFRGGAMRASRYVITHGVVERTRIDDGTTRRPWRAEVWIGAAPDGKLPFPESGTGTGKAAHVAINRAVLAALSRARRA